ncbi:hypothetical protein ACWIGW_41540 [Nocardia brasiliensis]
MKKIHTFGLLCVTAASIAMAGPGSASAEASDIQASTTPPASSGSGSGSAALIEGIAKLFNSGSGPYCPGGAGCPK